MKNKIKKIISSLFVFLIIGPIVLFSIPQITHAQDAASGNAVDTAKAAADTAAVAATATAAAASAACGTFALGNGTVSCVVPLLASYLAVSSTIKSKAATAKTTISTPPYFKWIQSVNNFLTTTATTNTAIYDWQDLALALKRVAKEVLRQVLISVGHKLLDTMTQSTVNWINSGFHGSPLFVQNPGSFFSNIGKFEVKNIINMVGYDPKQPFGQQYALNLIAAYKAKSQNDMQSSLNLIINDPALATQYRNNFNYGGWNALLLNTQYPQNNWIGYNMMMNQTVASKLAGNTSTSNTIQKAQTLLKQGNGFLSPTMCPSNIPNADAYNKSMANEFNPPQYPTAAKDEQFYGKLPACVHSCLPGTGSNSVNNSSSTGSYSVNNSSSNGASKFPSTGTQSFACVIDTSSPCTNQAAITDAENTADALSGADKAQFAATSQCLNPNGTSALVATTPGAVVANHIMTALNLKTGVAGLDAALGNSFSAILNAFMNHFLSQGLSAMSSAISSSPSSNSNWSYDGQTLDSTNAAAIGGALTIPTNVSVNIGDSTSTTITGGTAPYSIQTQPDSTIATAQISADGSSLSVTGITQGTTTTTIQDSTSANITATPVAQVNTITINGSSGTAGMISATINSITTSILVSYNDTPTTAATNLTNAINANTKLSSTVTATNTTAGVITVTSNTPGTAGVFSLTSTNTTTLLVPTSATETPASDGTSPNQTATVTITVGTNGTIAVNFTNTTNNPTSISTSVGDNVTKLTLSGGIAPYNIQTQPDSTMALALVSDNNLSIIGIAPGTTSIILQDSSTPAVTINLQIIVGTETPLVATPSSIAAVANGSSTTITLSGGTPPFTILTQPDPVVGSVMVSGNNLIYIGAGAGNTSMTVEDSFSPAETITIPVTSKEGAIPSLSIPTTNSTTPAQ
jgi:hypothetical protein